MLNQLEDMKGKSKKYSNITWNCVKNRNYKQKDVIIEVTQ